MSKLDAVLGWLARHRRMLIISGAAVAASGFIFTVGAVAGVLVQRVGLIDRAGSALGRSLSSFDDADARTFEWSRLETALVSLEQARVPLGPVAQAGGGGGGIVEVGNGVLFMTAVGDLGYLSHDGALAYLDAHVEMGLDALRRTEVYNGDNFVQTYFRTHDLHVDPRADGGFDLYASHHRYRPAEGCIEVVLARADLTVAEGAPVVDQASWRDVFAARPCVDPASLPRMFAGHQSGGRIVQYDEERILFSMGDLGLDGGTQPDFFYDEIPDDLAKIFLIDTATGEAEVFASGLRNAQGLLVASDGRIWETEHGKQGGDELNLIRRGENYGWPHVTLGTDYGGDQPRKDWWRNSHQGRHEGYAPPQLAFVPSIGVGNLIEIPADVAPLWAGDLLIGSLREQSLYRVRLQGDHPLYVEPIPMNARLRDIIVLRDGRIALLTDDPEIIFLRPTSETAPETLHVTGYRAARAHLQAGRPPAPELTPEEEGRRLFAGRCASCHAVRPENEVGPHLVGVVGRDVAALEGYAYSTGLAEAGGRWSEGRLKRFLAEPERVAPGSLMPPVSATSAELDRIVDYLKTVN